jgi:hypothetical protein
MGTKTELHEPVVAGELLLLQHLGLGDHLICGAIVRDLAKRHLTVTVLCKPHNIHSVSFFFRDAANVECFSVENDDEAQAARKAVIESGHQAMGLGIWSDLPFDRQRWDRSFFEQYGLDFQQRWSGFVCVRQPSRELPVPAGPYALVHDDPKRGCLIDPKHLPDMEIVRLDPAKSANLFDWWGIIESATELHFMESSPAILADSLPALNAKRAVIHHYCRESIPPTYQLSWEHLR